MAKRLLHKDKKTGTNSKPIVVPCIRVRQSNLDLYVFKLRASVAWSIFFD
jgi:O6-methylguanine-DNA--protein-cysteine methyltransferase